MPKARKERRMNASWNNERKKTETFATSQLFSKIG